MSTRRKKQPAYYDKLPPANDTNPAGVPREGYVAAGRLAQGPSEDATAAVLGEVVAERIAQDAKWGEQNHHPDRWLVILMEEIGEASERVLACDHLGYRAEMVQAAAVAVAMVESIDRWATALSEEAPPA